MNNKCFAFKDGECKVLKKSTCRGCKFAKTKRQFALDALKYVEKEIEFLGLSAYAAYKLREKYKKGALEND